MDTFAAGEFKKKYRGSYIEIEDIISREKLIGSVQEVRAGHDGRYFMEFHVILNSNKSESKNILLGSFNVLEHPDKHLFDYQGFTYLYSRRLDRQWIRGVSQSNSRCSLVLFPYIKKLDFKDFTIGIREMEDSYTYEKVRGIFRKQQEVRFMEAVKILSTTTNISITLSKTYFLSCTPYKETLFLLFRNCTPVAWYDSKADTFSLFKPIYAQEILDFCYRSNLSSSVVE